MTRVVVSAATLLTPIGNGLARFREGLFAGRSGVRPVSEQEKQRGFPMAHIGSLDGEAFAEWNPARQTKSMAAARWLARDLLANIPRGLAIDAMLMGARELNQFYLGVETLRRRGYDREREFLIEHEGPLRTIAAELEASGMGLPPPTRQVCVSNGCVTGATVIGDAFHRIRAGEWSRALVGALELDPNPFMSIGLFLLGALDATDCPSQKASRPYSLGRAGLVKGEAGGLMLLESFEEAVRRGATPLAEVVGYASTNDAWRVTDGRDDSEAAAAAIRLSIQDAGLKPEDIGYINGHGTSTPLGDRLECRAIKKVFGELARNIPVSSLKSQIGHSIWACGMVEAIATGLMLQNQRIAPTINYKPDPELDLDFVPNVARTHSMQVALSTNFGFGGQNTALVLRKFPPASQ
jgi:3-oxoacyl-[acyl-carrier-protein] synthase II